MKVKLDDEEQKKLMMNKEVKVGNSWKMALRIPWTGKCLYA